MKKFNSLLIFCFVIGIIITGSCFGQNQIKIQDSTTYFTNTIRPDQLKVSIQDQKFLIQPDKRFDFGLITNSYNYIVIKVQANRPSNSYALSIDNTSLDTVLIYRLLTDTSKVLLCRGGNLIKYDINRNYVWHTIPLIISNEPHFYLVAVKALSKNVNVQYKILKLDDLQKLYSRFDKAIYFYLGIISLIVFACLLSFILLRNQELIIFACYIAGVSMWILAHYGYIFPLLCPSFPQLNDVIKPVSSLAAVFSFLILINFLFKKDFKGNLFERAIVSLNSLNLFMIVAAFIRLIAHFSSYTYTLFNVVWHILIIVSIGSVAIMLFVLFKTGKTAQIFALAISLMLIMTLVQVFSNIRYIKSTFLNDHGLLIATLLQILTLSFAIIYNIWGEKKMKDTQLRILEEDQKNTLQMLITIQDNERKRIAEELHDSIGPMLAAIKINFLRALKPKSQNHDNDILVTKTEDIIDDSITEIRNISHQLMPKSLSSKGLIALLTEYFDNLQTVYNTCINFTHSITTILNKDVQLNLYRIISELVLNAAKHSKSKNIKASIETLVAETLVVVNDDGIGFNTAQKNGSSLGLKNIESRVAYLKGEMEIQSIIEKGTIIKISVPNSNA